MDVVYENNQKQEIEIDNDKRFVFDGQRKFTDFVK